VEHNSFTGQPDRPAALAALVKKPTMEWKHVPADEDGGDRCHP
jgi:hypothetical protein